MTTQKKASRPGRDREAIADTNSTGPEYSTARLTLFLPLNLADFAIKDNELSTDEHLVFLRLVTHFWVTQWPLPTNDKALARIARLTVQSWRRHCPTVRRYFDETPDGWVPYLYIDELVRAQEIAEKRREAGQKGGKKSGQSRQEKIKQLLEANGKQIEANGKQLLPADRSKRPSKTPSKNEALHYKEDRPSPTPVGSSISAPDDEIAFSSPAPLVRAVGAA